MKTILSILILAIFLFLIGGRLVVGEILVSENRAAMMKMANDWGQKRGLVSFDLGDSETATCIDGKELSYKGRRYDIVAIVHQGRRVMINALADADEDRLLNAMDFDFANAAQKNPFGHRSATGLLDDFFKEYTSGRPLQLNPYAERPLQTQNLHAYNPLALDGYTSLVIPPPKQYIS